MCNWLVNISSFVPDFVIARCGGGGVLNIWGVHGACSWCGLVFFSVIWGSFGWLDFLGCIMFRIHEIYQILLIIHVKGYEMPFIFMWNKFITDLLNFFLKLCFCLSNFFVASVCLHQNWKGWLLLAQQAFVLSFLIMVMMMVLLDAILLCNWLILLLNHQYLTGTCATIGVLWHFPGFFCLSLVVG